MPLLKLQLPFHALHFFTLTVIVPTALFAEFELSPSDVCSHTVQSSQIISSILYKNPSDIRLWYKCDHEEMSILQWIPIQLDNT